MKLRFSFRPDELSGKEALVKECLARLYPYSALRIDGQNGILELELPDTVDREMAERTVAAELASVGLHVSLADGASPYDAPPIRMDYKQPRVVKLSTFIISLICVVVATALLSLTLFSSCSLFSVSGPLGQGEEMDEDYALKIGLVDAIFDEYSVYSTDGKLLLDEMLKAYVAATGDRYAAYYTEEEFAALVAENAAQAVGIGISVTNDNGKILIIDVFPGSPAEEAGVLVGDSIVSIGSGENRVLVAEKGYEESLGLLSGTAGSVAEFSVQRGDAEIPFSVARRQVTSRSVRYRVSETDSKVGVVIITSFDIETPAQFKVAMDNLIAAGCERFVFDLRNNPGGDLNAIVAVMSLFLNKGDTITTTTRTDGTTTVYTAKAVNYGGAYEPCSITEEEIGKYRGYPMAVLTNGYTASAAELFTIVMKDYGLASIVGEKTFGKGVYQNIIGLENWGYTGGVRLTVGKYNPPISQNFDGVGIEPTHPVVLSEAAAAKNFYLLTEAEDNQLQAAITAIKPQ